MFRILNSPGTMFFYVPTTRQWFISSTLEHPRFQCLSACFAILSPQHCVSIFPLALLFLNWFKVFKLMWNFQTSLKLNMLKSAIDSGNIKQNSEIIWQMFFKGHCDLQVCGSRCTFSLSLSEWRYFQKKNCTVLNLSLHLVCFEKLCTYSSCMHKQRQLTRH